MSFIRHFDNSSIYMSLIFFIYNFYHVFFNLNLCFLKLNGSFVVITIQPVVINFLFYKQKYINKAISIEDTDEVSLNICK